MRSRYTAYARQNRDYLLQTWHPAHQPGELSFDRETKWLGLTIKRTEAGTADDEEGVVEFVARYKIGGRAYRLHEVSRFVRESGRWYYLDGQIQPSKR